MSEVRFVTSRRVLWGEELGPAAIEICPTSGTILSVKVPPTGQRYQGWVSALQAEGQVDDRGDCVITPAFIDSHTHLALNMLRGTGVGSAAAGNVVEDLFYRVESHLEPGDVQAFATLGAYEALIHGTGLVWEHYFHAEELASAIADVGLCGVVAPTIQDLFGPGVEAAERQLEVTLKLASEGGARGVYAALGPHATDTVSASMWQRIAEVAERESLPIHAHLAQSVEEVERVAARDNTTPVGLLLKAGVLEAAPKVLLVHNLFLTEADLHALGHHHTTAVMGFCPRSQWVFAFPADPRRWDAVNLPWVLGTDCTASNDTLSIGLELTSCAAALRGRVVHGEPYARFLAGEGSPATVWQARQEERALTTDTVADRALLSHVWSTPGAMHPGLTAGVIAPGALANLIVWDVDHPSMWPAQSPLRALTHGVPSGAISHVMTRGQWRGERGSYAISIRQSERYKAACDQATARRDALLKRSGLGQLVR